MEGHSTMNLSEKTIGIIKHRRKRILDGKINVIPSPFKRFRVDFDGIDKGQYILVTSFTKGGKTQFVCNLLFEALMYCIEHKDKEAKIKVLWFPLEETPEKIMMRFQCWLLWQKKGIRISPKELKSTEKPVDLSVIKALESDELKQYINYFEQCFEFCKEVTADGIKNRCTHYAHTHGQVVMRKVKLENGEIRSVFDHYIPFDDNEYVIPVVDNINIIDTDEGSTKKQTIDRLSEYCSKSLRNRFNMTPIIIQQQNTDNETDDVYRVGRNRPNIKGLGDSKYTARDCDIMIGLYSPYRFDIKEYLGYDISKLKDHFRTIEVIINREGEMGGIIGLYFDGANTTWCEMPKPESTLAVHAIYEQVKNIEK